MTDPDHEDKQDGISDLVDDPISANMQAPQIISATKLYRALARISRQAIDRPMNPRPHCRVELLQFAGS